MMDWLLETSAANLTLFPDLQVSDISNNFIGHVEYSMAATLEFVNSFANNIMLQNMNQMLLIWCANNSIFGNTRSDTLWILTILETHGYIMAPTAILATIFENRAYFNLPEDATRASSRFLVYTLQRAEINNNSFGVLPWKVHIIFIRNCSGIVKLQKYETFFPYTFWFTRGVHSPLAAHNFLCTGLSLRMNNATLRSCQLKILMHT